MPTTIKRIVSVLYRARTNKYEVQAVAEKKWPAMCYHAVL